jgi:hypothetical protein
VPGVRFTTAVPGINRGVPGAALNQRSTAFDDLAGIRAHARTARHIGIRTNRGQ